jgi:DNA-directed RNA polymerase specialized sigma24 family protein
MMLDPSLRGFVEAIDEADAERRLGTLLEEQAEPLIRKIVAHKLGTFRDPGEEGGARQDLEDITADAVLALVSRLQALRADPEGSVIESFPDYTATVAYNTFAHYLRRRHPERSRLKNRLRYLLTRDRRFALWPTPEGPVCGQTGWRARSASREAASKLEEVTGAPDRWLRWTSKGQTPGDDPADLVSAVLQAIGGPVEFDRLVGAIAALSAPEAARETRSATALDAMADEASPPADVAYERRRSTQRLWGEVCLLPLRQRVALLLNLRDVHGSGLLWVFPLTGVASIRQIARALEMPDLELAEIWNRLPLDDRRIAERLGCTRQQVINLRSAARKRLGHRLDEPAAGPPPSGTGNTRAVSASLEDEA